MAQSENRNEVAEIVVIATGQSKATSASKAETPLIESPQTISVISREEMDLRAVATVSDALAYTAGVRGEATGIDSPGVMRGHGGVDLILGRGRSPSH